FLLLGGAFARRHPDDALAAAALRAERAHRRAFDEAAMRDADDAAFVGDEIFHVNLAFIGDELGQTRRAMLITEFAQLFLHNREDARLFRKNIAQIVDRFH